MSERTTSDTSLEHTWRYFELHAKQRVYVFNFFLLLSGAVSAGIAAALQSTPNLASLGMVLGILLMLVSFVFWKLDQRVSFLIKHAERALAELECALPGERSRLFYLEPQNTELAVNSGSWWSRHWTYGKSFRVIFIIMGLFGAGSSVLLALKFAGIMYW